MSTALWQEEPTVFVVDRDPVFCQTLRAVVRALHLRAKFFVSGEELLQGVDAQRPGCLAIDLAVPRWAARELFERLGRHGLHQPALIVSPKGDVPVVVEAMRAGALNYLQKPCAEQQLAAAVRDAVAWDAVHRKETIDAARIRRRLSRLTPGERQVLEMLVSGMTNKEVAEALGRSVRAIEVRRAKIRTKMRADGLADLVRQAVAGRHGVPGRRTRPTG